jgi:hypothetical protein
MLSAPVLNVGSSHSNVDSAGPNVEFSQSNVECFEVVGFFPGEKLFFSH